MDCSTCRSEFSASFDGRLAGEDRQAFGLHVQHCEPCASEFALYRRVFSTIRDLPEDAAPPFRMPAETPGSRALPPGFSARPRFARVAASLLLAVGLVGTHVMVFQWSREQARVDVGSSRIDPGPPANVPILATNLGLPASLRDHVEATDLFIHTAAQAAQLPQGSGARDLAIADWAASDLERRTAALLTQNVHGPDQVAIARYLHAVQGFIAPTRRVMEDQMRGGSVRAVCDAAVNSGVVREIESMRPIVEPLPRGTWAYVISPSSPAVARLGPDGRLILEAKRARLSGHLPRSIEKLERFDRDFVKSSYDRVAGFLHAEALWKAGRYNDATAVWSRYASAGRCAPREVASGFIQVLNNSNLLLTISFDCQTNVPDFLNRTQPMKSTRGLSPLVEDPGQR